MKKSLLMSIYQNYVESFVPLNRELKSFDMNLQDSLILLALFFEPSKKLYPSDLEKGFSIPKDQISQSLKKLETMFLIHRKLDHHDKRKRIIEITGNGTKKASRLIKVFDTHEEKLENKV